MLCSGGVAAAVALPPHSQGIVVVLYCGVVRCIWPHMLARLTSPYTHTHKTRCFKTRTHPFCARSHSSTKYTLSRTLDNHNNYDCRVYRVLFVKFDWFRPPMWSCNLSCALWRSLGVARGVRNCWRVSCMLSCLVLVLLFTYCLWAELRFFILFLAWYIVPDCSSS